MSSLITIIIVVAWFTLVYFTGAPSISLEEAMTADPYGFWGGLWHGLIVLPTFLIQLFSDQITIYAINNNGGWYNFGYVAGLTGFFGLTGVD